MLGQVSVQKFVLSQVQVNLRLQQWVCTTGLAACPCGAGQLNAAQKSLSAPQEPGAGAMAVEQSMAPRAASNSECCWWKTSFKKKNPRNYLGDWILSRGRSFVSAKVDHNPAFWYVCHPDAFKQLSLIQVEELPWAVLLSIFPTSFVPIVICCNSIHDQAVKRTISSQD